MVCVPSRLQNHNSGENLILWRTLIGLAAFAVVWVPERAADGIAAWTPLAALPMLLLRSRRSLVAAACCLLAPLQRFVLELDLPAVLVAAMLPLVVMSWPIPETIPDSNSHPT